MCVCVCIAFIYYIFARIFVDFDCDATVPHLVKYLCIYAEKFMCVRVSAHSS